MILSFSLNYGFLPYLSSLFSNPFELELHPKIPYVIASKTLSANKIKLLFKKTIAILTFWHSTITFRIQYIKLLQLQQWIKPSNFVKCSRFFLLYGVESTQLTWWFTPPHFLVLSSPILYSNPFYVSLKHSHCPWGCFVLLTWVCFVLPQSQVELHGASTW